MEVRDGGLDVHLDLEMAQNVEIHFFERIWDHVDVGFQDIPTINL